MIEWDEVNWRSAIGIIIFALIVIGLGIFAINDYMSSKRIKADMESDLAKVEEFYSLWKPPSQRGLAQMKSRVESLQKEVEKTEPKLQLELDLNQLQQMLRQLAASVGVSLERMELQPETMDGFLKVYPLKLSIKGANEQLSRFLIGIENQKIAYRRQGNPAISSGQLELTLEFLTFDQQAWDKSYSCSIQAKPPELKEIDISRIKIFKDGLGDLAEKINANKAKLAESKDLLKQQCELEREIKALEQRLNLAKALAH